MSPDYQKVRTNWVSMTVRNEHAAGTGAPTCQAELIFVSAAQLSSGTISIPAKRAEAIFSLPPASTAGNERSRIVVATEAGRDDEDDDEDGGCGRVDQLIPIREPFSPAKVHGQRALPPKSMTPVTHTVREDNKAVVWSADGKRGFLAKLRAYASQPTQVFLVCIEDEDEDEDGHEVEHEVELCLKTRSLAPLGALLVGNTTTQGGMHAIFDGFGVTAGCVVCFVSTGVLGHAQMVVGHEGGADGLYAQARANVVLGFDGMRGARGRFNGSGCGSGCGSVNVNVAEVGMELAPLRVQTARVGEPAVAVAVVDERFGCFLRTRGGGEEEGDEEDGDVRVVDSCGLPRTVYLAKRGNGGVGAKGQAKRARLGAGAGAGEGAGAGAGAMQDSAGGDEGHGESGESGEERDSENVAVPAGKAVSQSLSQSSSARRAFGSVNAQQMAQGSGQLALGLKDGGRRSVATKTTTRITKRKGRPVRG